MDKTHGQILWENFVEQESQLDINYYQLVMTCILPSNPIAQFREEGLAWHGQKKTLVSWVIWNQLLSGCCLNNLFTEILQKKENSESFVFFYQ